MLGEGFVHLKDDSTYHCELIIFVSVPTDKPLPPSNVIVNVSSTGYYLSWDYKEVPGRPLVDKFVVEYRENNTSNAWIRVEEGVDGKERSSFLRAILFDSYKVYEFRVYAFGNKFSEPAYASKTFIIGETSEDYHK